MLNSHFSFIYFFFSIWKQRIIDLVEAQDKDRMPGCVVKVGRPNSHSWCRDPAMGKSSAQPFCVLQSPWFDLYSSFAMSMFPLSYSFPFKTSTEPGSIFQFLFFPGISAHTKKIQSPSYVLKFFKFSKIRQD